VEGIKLYIDGKTVETEVGKTVLDAALAAGIYIPHLCHHPELPSAGACRLCVVEIEDMPGLSTSCTTPATEGMAVRTRSTRVDRIRRLSMELMLSTHPTECTDCPKYLNCELQSLKQFLEVGDLGRFRRRPKVFPVNSSNPLFVHDFSRCILCGRCVRACRDLRGAEVLSFMNRGSETSVGTAFDRSLVDAGCLFCGACVEVCPTGSLRDQERVLPGTGRKALVPCGYTCPAGIDVPRYVRFIKEADCSAATAVIREKVPFPATLGYVCRHPCETTCRRGEINDAIAIKELKRFAAERDTGQWKQRSRKDPPTRKRVAVIGSGPAGLTAAYYLAKLGHGVTVFEALPFPGGMPRVGIPEHRLPVGVLEAEIEEIESAGVEIRTNVKIDSPEALLKEGCDAVLVAIGAHHGQKLPIPGADLDGVLTNIPFLTDVRCGRAVHVGKRVVVLGGGDVAFDCARTAVRLGAEEVTIACLEAEDCMLATPEEIAQGQDEGVSIHDSRHFTRIVGEDGKVSGVECQDVARFEFDEEGRLDVECVEGSTHFLPADAVIFAIGQRPEIPQGFGLAIDRGGRVEVEDYNLATDKEGVFAAGDAVTGTTSVIEAIAAGRKAATAIDEYLGGSGIIDEELAPAQELRPWLGRDESFASLPRCQALAAPGYPDDCALEESERCLQCDMRLKIRPIRFWADYSLPQGAMTK
jgi:formate dehydrogenase (NADP+) beta subunit